MNTTKVGYKDMDEYNAQYDEALSELRRARHNYTVARNVAEEAEARLDKAYYTITELEGQMAESVKA